MRLPKVKTDNIVVQDLQSELLIYDLTMHRAFTLNETSKIVYQACGGQISFDDLKRKYQFTDELIHFALAELAANDLLVDYQSDYFKNLSRREVIRRVGLATMIALPMIAGMTVPAAAEAQSALAPGTLGASCSGASPCNSGFVCCAQGNVCKISTDPGTPPCTSPSNCCIPFQATAVACQSDGLSTRCCLPPGQNSGGFSTRCCNPSSGTICS